MLPPLRFYSSVSNVDASPDALASGFELFACSTFLLERFAFDHACPYVPIGAFRVRSRLSLRSYWSVSRSITSVPTFLLERFTFDYACCLTHSAKQNGLRNVSFLFRRGSGPPVVRSQRPSDYRTQLVHFGIVRFFAAIPTENKRTKKLRRIGERSRRRGVGAFLRKHIGLAMLSAGSPLGATRPQTCAKEPLALWTLVI